MKHPYCNVPNPPTNEEDATIPLSIRATIPMNIHIKTKMLWSKTCIHCYHTAEEKPYIQAFSVFIMFIKQQNTICRDEIVKNTYLMRNSSHNQLCRCNVPPNHRPACSSMSQQHCHPRAGHDSIRTKGHFRLTHSQGSQRIKPTQLGFTRSSRS